MVTLYYVPYLCISVLNITKLNNHATLIYDSNVEALPVIVPLSVFQNKSEKS